MVGERHFYSSIHLDFFSELFKQNNVEIKFNKLRGTCMSMVGVKLYYPSLLGVFSLLFRQNNVEIVSSSE